MLARYQLEHELGTGAHGAVFRGREKRTGRVVAVKLVPCSLADEQREFACADGPRLRLTHPNIALVHEIVAGRTLRYVVMEVAGGVDLAAHTRPGHLLRLPTVLMIVARVSGALQYAHDCGVVHADVKPANIVYDAHGGSVKLIDFPSCGTAPGTPAYMAPEQLCGEAATPASDQFALGVTLYQLACGHLPFGGRSRAEIAYKTVHAPHTDIRVHAPALPADLGAIVDTALAKNPGARYRSMTDMQCAVTAAHARLADVRPVAAG